MSRLRTLPESQVAARAPGYRPFGAFRFGLAMMVLVQHGLLLLPPAGRALFYGLELGSVAVTCFFALSGFIVAEALGCFYAGRPWAFLANRVLRVVPPYLAALALAVAVEGALFAAGRLAPLDAPLQGAPWQPQIILAGLCEIVPGLPVWRVSGQGFSLIGFAWTLRVEFAFYLAAFGMSWLCTAIEAQKPVPAPPSLTTFRSGPRPLPRPGNGDLGHLGGLVIFAAAAVAYGVFGVFLLRHGAGPRQVLCVPFFAFGVGCFLVNRRRDALAWSHLAAVGALVPVAFTYWGQRGHPVLAFQLPLVCGLFAVLALLTFAPRLPKRLQAIDRRLGTLSYPLYIGHGIVLVALTSLFDQRGWPLYFCGIAASLALAACLHECAERPIKVLRDRLRGTAIS